jgi:hypothetical protein
MNIQDATLCQKDYSPSYDNGQSSASPFADHNRSSNTPQLTVQSTMEPDRLSPGLAGFSFGSNHSEPTSPTCVDHEPLLPVQPRKESMRPIKWDSPGSPRELDQDASRRASRAADSRRNSESFEDSFAYKDDWETHKRDNAVRHSPIVAELRTNVIVLTSSHR